MCKIELAPNLWQPNNRISRECLYPSFHAANNTVRNEVFLYLISLFPPPNSPLYDKYIITIVISHAIYFF